MHNHCRNLVYLVGRGGALHCTTSLICPQLCSRRVAIISLGSSVCPSSLRLASGHFCPPPPPPPIADTVFRLAPSPLADIHAAISAGSASEIVGQQGIPAVGRANLGHHQPPCTYDRLKPLREGSLDNLPTDTHAMTQEMPQREPPALPATGSPQDPDPSDIPKFHGQPRTTSRTCRPRLRALRCPSWPRSSNTCPRSPTVPRGMRDAASGAPALGCEQSSVGFPPGHSVSRELRKQVAMLGDSMNEAELSKYKSDLECFCGSREQLGQRQGPPAHAMSCPSMRLTMPCTRVASCPLAYSTSLPCASEARED